MLGDSELAGASNKFLINVDKGIRTCYQGNYRVTRVSRFVRFEISKLTKDQAENFPVNDEGLVVRIKGPGERAGRRMRDDTGARERIPKARIALGLSRIGDINESTLFIFSSQLFRPRSNIPPADKYHYRANRARARLELDPPTNRRAHRCATVSVYFCAGIPSTAVRGEPGFPWLSTADGE